ncbi:MAG: methyltransferase [Rhodobacterales bacterium 32-67-9]|nr:MAG: methyltransferase [Rhodobacterales bacterium 32-67-9]
MFDEADLSEDAFLGGRIRIVQPRHGYRAAMDPVLLAAAVPARAGDSVLDLGCGAGVASLCLGHRVPGLRLAGLELQPAYAALARRNAAANGQEFEVHDGDLARLPEGLRVRSFDHVIANPPYFPAGAGTPAADCGRETAQREATPLELWLGVALRRLRPGGWLTVIQAAERLPELLAGLWCGAGSITARPVAARQGREANRVIIQARKGGRGAFRLAAPFVLHEGAAHLRDGDDHSAAARAILRDGAAFLL